MSENTIKIKIEDFYLTLPHPANFALHKLIISERRTKGEKAIKDKNAAILILKALINKGESRLIKGAFHLFAKKLQNKIISILEEVKEEEILEVLR